MSRTLAALSAHDLSYRLPDGRLLFHDLTLDLGQGITAVVGPNGSGKSTLLDLLEGARPPSTGRVTRRGRVLRLPQRPEEEAARLRPEGARAVDLLGLGEPWDALARLESGEGSPRDLELVAEGWELPLTVERILAEAGLPALDPHHPVLELSGGEITRLALAGVRHHAPEVVLLDEPTNHLDAPAREALRAWLTGWGGGAVVVTHDRDLLEVTDRVLELGAGARPHLVTGSLGDWLQARENREEGQAEALRRARSERDRARRERARALERQARRSSAGRRAGMGGGMPKILLGMRKRQAEGTSGRIREGSDARVEAAQAELREALEDQAPSRRPSFDPSPSGLEGWRDVLRLEGVGVPGLFGPLDRRWSGPVRVGLTGPSGSGKSTLLRILAGEREPGLGSLHLGVPPTRRAFIPQLVPLPPGRDPLHAFRLAHPELPESRARQLLDALLFTRAGLGTPVAALSQGERVRLAFALALGGTPTPALLLLDEPTNHLELATVEALEVLLARWDGALVVASHDRHFLAGVGMTEEVALGGSGTGAADAAGADPEATSRRGADPEAAARLGKGDPGSRGRWSGS